MAIDLQTRVVESADAAELFISAVPTEITDLPRISGELFQALRDKLQAESARILQEWIIAPADSMSQISAIRSDIYGSLDAGVPATLLCCKPGETGPLSGVAIHAIRCDSEPRVIQVANQPRGRVVRTQNCTYATLSGISMPHISSPEAQAQSMLIESEAALKALGGDFFRVPRTWMWLGDILAWYDPFNGVRNRFFTERGILGPGGKASMPASTGIGLGPPEGACSMDLVAIIDPPDEIELLSAGGRQQSAYEYGSAFSRASSAPTPAGKTVYVSGTASIDETGATTHLDDPQAQIETTIENVRAILRDMNANDDDVVQIIAYSKTPEIERIFQNYRKQFDWPWISGVCDVCRDNLLFEIEATAMLHRP